MSGMKKGKRYSPEGEVMGSTYRSRERSRFGESALEMSLGTTLGSELGDRRVPTNVFLGGNSDGKTEDSCLWETVRVGSYDVSLVGLGRYIHW